MSRSAPRTATLRTTSRRESLRLRRDRRYAVRLHHTRREDQREILRRLRGPSSWRCAPHAGPHAQNGEE
jgi:hypothetical protein